ncbi:restriction endonuclease subunit S [Mesorhizobium sp. PL10]
MSSVRAGYKLTEVGVIPQDWEVRCLEQVCQVKGGKRLPQGRSLVQDITPYPYVRVSDMKDGTVNTEAIQYVPVDVFPVIKRYTISSSDLYISVAGTLGLVGRIPSSLDGANLTENADKLTDITCNRDLLFYCIQTDRIQSEIESKRTVGAQPKLAIQEIQGFQVALPTDPIEQQAIAEALGTADALINALEALIDKKRDIKQGAMQKLLTGSQRLPGFQKKWTREPLSAVCTKIQDGTHFSPKVGGGDFLYITSRNIGAGKLNLSEVETVSAAEHLKIYARCDTRSGDLLITKDGASTGNAAMNTIDEPISLLSSVAFLRFSPKHCAEYFLYQLLSEHGQNQIKGQMSGNAITRITLKKIKALLFDVPTIEEQIAIAAALSDMDAGIAALECKLAKARDVKQGMMQSLLTGEIRLI